jgi:hypothetical protein
MAFVVATRNGTYEIRESRSTPKGPRSRTLATFRELDDAVIDKARARSDKSLSEQDVRKAAQRAGAPGARAVVDRAARELIAELGKGRRLDPALRHLLLDLLAGENGEEPARSSSETERAVAAWMASTPRERGNALVDLLLLTDALPHEGRAGKPLEFPRLNTNEKGNVRG